MLSPIGCNAFACCSYFGLSVLDLFRVNKQLAWEIEKDVPCTIADRCSVISELLCIKFKFLNMPLLSCAEIDCAISCLCTD